MAMICVNGVRECDGCMRCLSEPKPVMRCRTCKGPIYEGDYYYIIDEEIVCEECICEHRHTA